MSNDGLMDRRTWFRYFPEGSIEFLLITRVLGTASFLVLSVLQATQRPLMIVILAGVLWLDYLLTLWWGIQLSTDLTAMGSTPRPPADVLRTERLRAMAIGMLPATMLFAALVPWPSQMPLIPAGISGPVHRFAPLLLVPFAVSLVPAYRALQRVRLGPASWTLLSLIPILHWPAVHRLCRHFQSRMQELAGASPQPGPADYASSNPVLVLADVTWGLAVMPWLILTASVMIRGQWPAHVPLSLLPPCGTFLVAVFAVADLAALEGVQRRFVALIRRA